MKPQNKTRRNLVYNEFPVRTMITVHNAQFSSMSLYFKGEQIIHSSLTNQTYSSGLTPNTSSNSNCAEMERTASCVEPLVLQLNFCWHCSSAGLCCVTAFVRSDRLVSEGTNGASMHTKHVAVIFLCKWIYMHLSEGMLPSPQFSESLYCKFIQMKLTLTCLIASDWTNSS